MEKLRAVARYIISLIACWWLLAFIVGGIGAFTVGNAAAAAEIWVFGLAVIVAFFVQAKLPFWQD